MTVDPKKTRKNKSNLEQPVKPKIGKIILHIGSHKTGTTSIQSMLNKNERYLLENNVCSMVKIGMMHSTDKRHVERIKNLASIECDILIISNESYSWANEKEAEEFVNTIKKYAGSVEGIIYIRRQDKLAISHKQQGAISFRANLAYGNELSALPSQLSKKALLYLDFYNKIKFWDNFLDKIEVRRFEPSLLHKNDLILDFLRYTTLDQKINVEKIDIPPRLNSSMPRDNQLFLHNTREHLKNNNTARHVVLDTLSRKYKITDGDKLLPSKSDAKAFYLQFEESNNQLKKFLSIKETEDLFDESFSMYPDEVPDCALGTKEIYEMFGDVINVMLDKQIEVIKIVNRIKGIVNTLENSNPLAMRELHKLLSLLVHRAKPHGRSRRSPPHPRRINKQKRYENRRKRI